MTAIPLQLWNLQITRKSIKSRKKWKFWKMDFSLRSYWTLGKIKRLFFYLVTVIAAHFLSNHHETYIYFDETYLCKYKALWDNVQSARTITMAYIVFAPLNIINISFGCVTWKLFNIFWFNFIQISSTMKRLARHKNHNSGLSNFGVLSL